MAGRQLVALTSAIVILATGCSDATDTTTHSTTSVLVPPGETIEATAYPGLTHADVRTAIAYFTSFYPNPEGPELPESASANRLAAGCLEYFGVAVAYAGPGGIYMPPAPEQQARGSALVNLCFDAMIDRGLISVDYTDPDVARRRYYAYVVAYECLVRLGLDVEAPPSFETFVDNQEWWPFDGLATKIDSDSGTLEGPEVECGVP